MRLLTDTKLIVKIALPFTLTVLIGAGLIGYAHSVMHYLADQTAGIADVQAARLDSLLHLRGGITEAALMDRNMLLDSEPQTQVGFKARQQGGMDEARQAADRLVMLSGSSERRVFNEAMRRDVDSYFATLTRVYDVMKRGQRDEALRIAHEEGIPARLKLNDWIHDRAKAQEEELAAAKARSVEAATQGTHILIGLALAAFAVAMLLAGLIVVVSITRPLASLVGVLQRMAKGETEAEIREAARGDEIGAVGRAVESIKAMVACKAAEEAEVKRRSEAAAAAERRRTMIELANGFEAAVGGIVGLVSSSATELQATAQQLTATATATATQSSSVASAAEEAAANVTTVAAAAEELGASVAEIGRQVSGSADLAHQAVGEADRTASLVNELSGAVARIGHVVQLISTIAGQTNLLALNATIEAARAGEAGRGFAVVAAEVKELANQTAKATSEIAEQIDHIQGATGQAVSAIGSITERIREINAVAATIAAAVEEQGAATQEIVRNVSEASTGTTAVTGNIASVAQASEETGAAASQVLASASDLTRQSENLSAEVQFFLASVRSA